MADLDEDLHATAEDIATDATRLAEIEQEKADIPADDPRMVELSAAGEELARALVPKTQVELDLAREAQSS